MAAVLDPLSFPCCVEDKRCSAWTSVLSGGVFLFFFLANSRSRQASFPKDVVKLVEDELHRLVLVNHVDCHVTIVPLRAHQSGSEHDADVLRGHAVGV